MPYLLPPSASGNQAEGQKSNLAIIFASFYCDSVRLGRKIRP